MLKNDVKRLEEYARDARKTVFKMIYNAGKGHIGGALSVIEALIVLYYEQMRVDPANPRWEERDRLVLSKGHAGPGLYAVLAQRGFFPMDLVDTMNKPHTKIPSHCDMNLTTGIDMTTGSLGQGLSAATGMALGAKIDRKDKIRIFCVIGDGESQEGQIWEAAMYAAQMKLDNLIVMLDDNGLQIDDYTANINTLSPAEDKWKAFGWSAANVDGHNFTEINDAIEKTRAHTGKPNMIVMRTVKGKGWSKIENKVASHSMPISKDDYENAIGELDRKD
jgi:transketolase